MILKFMSKDLEDAKGDKAPVAVGPKPFAMPHDEPAPSANASVKPVAQVSPRAISTPPVHHKSERKMLLFALLFLLVLAGVLAYIFYPKIKAKYFPAVTPAVTAPSAPILEIESEPGSTSAVDQIAVNDKLRKENLPRFAKLLVDQTKKKEVALPTAPIYWKLNDENVVVTLLGEAMVEKGESERGLLDPRDPVYYYAYKSVDGKAFEFTAQLENLSDANCDQEFMNEQGKCIYRYQVDAATAEGL